MTWIPKSEEKFSMGLGFPRVTSRYGSGLTQIELFSKILLLNVLANNYAWFSESLRKCEPQLHVPRLRSDDTIFAYENDEIRFGCYSTVQKKGMKFVNSMSSFGYFYSSVSVSGPAGKFQSDLVKFAATRQNSGKYVCKSEDGLERDIFVRLLGKLLSLGMLV